MLSSLRSHAKGRHALRSLPAADRCKPNGGLFLAIAITQSELSHCRTRLLKNPDFLDGKYDGWDLRRHGRFDQIAAAYKDLRFLYKQVPMLARVLLMGIAGVTNPIR